MRESDRIVRELLEHEALLDRERCLREKDASQTDKGTTDPTHGQESARPRNSCAMAAMFHLMMDALRSFSWFVPWWDEDDRVLKSTSRWEEEEKQGQHTSLSLHKPLARRSCQSLTSLDHCLYPDRPHRHGL